jgi:peptidoglycan/LPS O-acetylase OafA/YrhL
MRNERRMPSLDGLRGIAAVAVMEFHFSIFFLPQARLGDILPCLGRAYLAVDLFFVLSGFVMAHVYGEALATNWRASWRDFAIARFARLYPVFAVTTVVMIIIAAVSATTIRNVSLSNGTLVLQPFLLQQWASGLSWNYPSWSISTEAEIYAYFVLFAGLLLAGKNPRLLAACCVAILIVISANEGGSLNYFVGARALLRTLADFSLGVLLYRAHVNDAGIPRGWVALSAVVLGGIALKTHLDFLMVGAFACLIYYCANATDSLAGRLLNSGPSVALGKWSYSIYLWHAPTHFAVMATLAALHYPVSELPVLSARLLIFLMTLVVVAMSAIHYQYFEMPMRRLILNLIPRIDQQREHYPRLSPVRSYERDPASDARRRRDRMTP